MARKTPLMDIVARVECGGMRFPAVISVPIPTLSAGVEIAYEMLHDTFGEEFADAFLDRLDKLAEYRGLVDSEGRRTRRREPKSGTV